MMYLLNTKSGKVHTDPPKCQTDPKSDSVEEVERLDALTTIDKCSVCFDDADQE